MTREQAANKIRKLIALSASSNPNEAAIALRQAQSMMRKHGIDQRTCQSVRTDQNRPHRAKKPPIAWADIASVIKAQKIIIKQQDAAYRLQTKQLRALVLSAAVKSTARASQL